MIIRSKAPLRLGFAGGGTDVSPYSDIYGGAILNACISMYAYATITPNNNGKVSFRSIDLDIQETFSTGGMVNIDGKLSLLKGVFAKIIKLYPEFSNIGFTLETYVDAPAGSGLGSSSTLVVAILKAFSEWLNLPLGEYDIAHLAYQIERIDLKQSGGKQDQYAATFGGVNFMEFYGDDKVIVNPLKIKGDYLQEMEHCLVLYYTGTSRLSSKIIDAQRDNVTNKNNDSIEAMHELKKQAVLMKEALLRGELERIGDVLNYGWQSKKLMATGITNPLIDEIYDKAVDNGASGGKVSGAGGGGFIMFYCPQNTRYQVIKALTTFGGQVYPFSFVQDGASAWKRK
jgi:D-glycero-alpha-D-manno-heptose-7-phosphate kinase